MAKRPDDYERHEIFSIDIGPKLWAYLALAVAVATIIHLVWR